MIVEMEVTKILCIAPKGNVHPIVSDVLIIDAFQPLGIVMEMRTVRMGQMSLRSTVAVRRKLVSGICTLAAMGIASPGATFVMGMTIVRLVSILMFQNLF